MSFNESYQYLFYRTYVWQLSMFGEANAPAFTAILANSLCVFFNLLTLVVWFRFLSGTPFRLQEWFAVAGIALVVLVNYFIFLHNDKFTKIVDKFSSEDGTQRKKRTVGCWTYVILTFLFFIGSVSFLN